MSDSCGCEFCKDYTLFKQNIELVPVEMREWLEKLFDARWNLAEELDYKQAVIDGDWPSSVYQLEHWLARAKDKQDNREPLVEHPDYVHQCDVVDISDGPCGDPSHEKIDPPVQVYDRSDNKCPDCKDGGYLVERTNSNTGNTFLGCSEFPDCKYTKSGGPNPAPTYSHDDDYEDDGWDIGDEMSGLF